MVTVGVMSKKKKLIIGGIVGACIPILALLSLYFCPLTIKYCTIGKPSFQKARAAADLAMQDSTDGPWEYSHGSFILGFDGTLGGRPEWVFRYRNPKTGAESRRIYVSIPEYEVGTSIGLDPLPFRGKLP